VVEFVPCGFVVRGEWRRVALGNRDRSAVMNYIDEVTKARVVAGRNDLWCRHIAGQSRRQRDGCASVIAGGQIEAHFVAAPHEREATRWVPFEE
jgi:hypothetical protein